MLIAKPDLQHLGLIDEGSVAVTYQREGHEFHLKLPIVGLNRPAMEKIIGLISLNYS